MLSPEERWLIMGVLALLLFGGIVKMCRDRVMENEAAKVQLPSVEASTVKDVLAR